LDFWTYGCINCIHNIPYLKLLAREFPEELVMIGVHSAKFSNEGETESIRNIILRYDLEHPVVNDRDFEVWRLWGSRAWPTLVLIDPAGYIVGGHTGEGFYETFRVVIASLIREFADRVEPTPIELQLERERLPETVLSFPGKVFADEEGNRLFIADTNHHRIIIADMDDGQALEVIGRGEAGYRDGDFTNALFTSPQGLALSGDGSTLYVADTGNHTIRMIDLVEKTVKTLAGTGGQADEYPLVGGTIPDVALSSPWDLVVVDNALYIAMAGSHQIWAINFEEGIAAALAGSGYEGWSDGSRQTAELAQPSGITSDGSGRLFFADSEGSTIRFSDISPQGNVGTIAGSGQSLFDFGDIDGRGTEARLQHPLGIAYHQGQLYVADTYNHKVKRIDIESAEVSTIAGSDRGWRDGPDPLFYEPGGISAAGDRLYIADTNNHSIRTIDLGSGRTTTLPIWGVNATTDSASTTYSGRTIRLEPAILAEGIGGISFDVRLPDGYKVTDLAPSTIQFEAEPDVAVLTGETVQHRPGLEFPIDVTGVGWRGSGVVTVDLTLLYCEVPREGLCLIERVRLEVPVEVVRQTDKIHTGVGDRILNISYEVEVNDREMSFQ